jgi:ethanolamine permease
VTGGHAGLGRQRIASVEYSQVGASYFEQRGLRLPHIERPYRSPLGIPGAVVALVIAAGTLIALFVSDPIYRQVVTGTAVWYALGLLYFAAYGCHRLVYSPEEEFAVRTNRGNLEIRALHGRIRSARART